MLKNLWFSKDICTIDARLQTPHLGTISLIYADIEEFSVSLFSEVSKGQQNFKQRLAKL